MLRIIILFLLLVPHCWPASVHADNGDQDQVRLTALPHPQNVSEARPDTTVVSSTLPKVLVLVSLSMDDAQLLQIFRDIQPMGGVMVLRGVSSGGMRALQQHLMALGISAWIDPWWFAFYHVQKVPTWIVPIPPFHRGFQQPGSAVELSGLLDVHTVLELMRRNVEHAEARQYIGELERKIGYE